jgi:hypothetical protein
MVRSLRSGMRRSLMTTWSSLMVFLLRRLSATTTGNVFLGIIGVSLSNSFCFLVVVECDWIVSSVCWCILLNFPVIAVSFGPKFILNCYLGKLYTKFRSQIFYLVRPACLRTKSVAWVPTWYQNLSSWFWPRWQALSPMWVYVLWLSCCLLVSFMLFQWSK